MTEFLGLLLRRDLSLSEIQEEIFEVEKRIKEKNISVLSHRIPDKITVNETERDKIIELKKSKKNIEKLKEDYAKDKILELITKNANLDEKILSYIRYSRKGRKFQIEKCQHIFLTCDLIVYNTNKYFNNFAKTVPEAISETAFTNLLFMNSPKFSGDAPVKLLISIFKSSHYIDDSMLGEFHKNLKAYLEQNPEKERYLGLVFQNQQLFGNIIDGTEKEYTEESSYISRMFDEAIKKDSENAISFAEKEAALIKKNEELQKLVSESVSQASEVGKLSISEKEMHLIIADADKSVKQAKKFVTSVVKGIVYFILFCSFLFCVFNGNYEQFANTKEWWSNLCLFSLPFWFCSAFSFEFLKKSNIDKIISSKLNDESSSIKDVLIKSFIKAVFITLLPICIGVAVNYLT